MLSNFETRSLTSMKRTFEWLRANLTGISTPVFGVSWQPTGSEKEAIRKLLVYLEDRRSLYVGRYVGTHGGRAEHVTQSVLEIRKEITETMKAVDFPQETKTVLESMRAACRDYLERGPSIVLAGGTNHARGSHGSLGPWQREMAQAVAALAIAYHVDLDDNLSQLVTISLNAT